MLREYAGVPSPLYDATKLGELAGARILLKREDLNHTGAHKIRNVLGQALLTSRMGKRRMIAETGAGQHGVATATAAAYLGLECTVYMGEVDTERQALNVARMQLLGAEVIPVTSGSRTLKDAINEAIRDWVATVDHTAYCFGTAAGPHPFPAMVRDFCRGIGDEARAQCLELTGALPDTCRRVCRRRLQRDRHLHRVPRGRVRGPLRFRGRRRGRRHGQARRDHLVRRGGRAPRRADLCPAGRGRPDRGVPLDLRGARLPRRRPPACPPRADRPGDVPPCHRRGRDGRLLPARPHRGDHPGDRVRPRGRRRARAGQGAAGIDDPGEPLRARRQGHGHRHRVVRPGPGESRAAPPGRPARSRSPRERSDLGAHRRPEHSRLVGVRARPDRGPRRARRLPARRFPRRPRRDRGAADDGRLRLRRDRDRPALQRPGDGRPDDPGRRPARSRGRVPRQRRDPHRRGGRRDRHPDAGDDLLEPGRAVRPRPPGRRRRRGGAVRQGPGQCRGSRPDHPGPHARLRRGVDRSR